MAGTAARTNLGDLTETSFPKVSISAMRRDHGSDFRAARLLLSVGAVILVCSGVSALAQIDSTQLIDRSSQGPHMVSKNQLLAPGKAQRAVEQAHKDMMNRHFESAQKEITRALGIAPHYGVAETLQGGVYLETGNDEGAAKYFQGAMDDDPALGAAYVGMGVVLMHQKRFQVALNLLDRAEELLPGAWFVHFTKAWDCLELTNIEAALKQVEFAERFAGTDREKRSAVSYLRAMVSTYLKDTDGARKYFAEAVARDPAGDYAALAKKKLERLQPLLAGSR